MPEYINPGPGDELVLPNTWVANGPGVTFTDNLITFSSSVDGVSAAQFILPAAVNGPFVVTITVVSITTGNIAFAFEGNPTISSAGTFTYPVSRMESQFGITSHLSNAVISRVSIRQLTDAQLGTELCANGTFDSSTDWTQTPDSPGTPWSISNGKLNAATESNGGYIASSTAPIVSGGLYRVSFTMLDAVAADTFVYICTAPNTFNGGFTGINGRTFGPNVGYGLADASGNIALYGGYALYSLDNLSLRRYVTT